MSGSRARHRAANVAATTPLISKQIMRPLVGKQPKRPSKKKAAVCTDLSLSLSSSSIATRVNATPDSSASACFFASAAAFSFFLASNRAQRRAFSCPQHNHLTQPIQHM